LGIGLFGSEGDGLAGSSCCNGRRDSDRFVATGVDGAANCLDRIPGSALVTVDVLCAGRVVLDHERLDAHGEITTSVDGRSFGPLNGSRGV
jgi:hypothetical protein